ncbi:hypothetical protein HKCCD6035_10555 [Rhodobacterales bacterium HKCCD6035]|nr:hypothetical protein [Rhodobacterales bacterium HKCCD6035]
MDAEGIFTFNAFGETIRMYLPDVAQDVIQGLIATTGSFFRNEPPDGCVFMTN